MPDNDSLFQPLYNYYNRRVAKMQGGEVIFLIFFFNFNRIIAPPPLLVAKNIYNRY